jgi:hypothetical protein
MQLDLHYAKTGTNGGDWEYTTTEACVFVFDMPHSTLPCDYKNEWLHVAATYDGKRETITMTISKGYAFDGCSVVPDFAGTVDAALIHWGWSVWAVLGFADSIFDTVMKYNHVNYWLRKTYYAGVRVFGWPYNRVARGWRWLTS